MARKFSVGRCSSDVVGMWLDVGLFLFPSSQNSPHFHFGKQIQNYPAVSLLH